MRVKWNAGTRTEQEEEEEEGEGGGFSRETNGKGKKEKKNLGEKRIKGFARSESESGQENRVTYEIEHTRTREEKTKEKKWRENRLFIFSL